MSDWSFESQEREDQLRESRGLRPEDIDECVRDIFRNHMKPHLREVYREILGERPKPNPDDFVPRKSR